MPILNQGMTDIRNILETARVKNKEHDLTGALIYCEEGLFIQFLEGPPDNLEQLLTNLKNDQRHRSLTVVYDDWTEARWFAGWRMGFVTESLLTHPERGAKASEYLATLKNTIKEKHEDEAKNASVTLAFGRLYALITQMAHLRDALPLSLNRL